MSEPTTRRRFLAGLPLAGVASSLAAGEETKGGSLTFGFITDVHHGTHGNPQVDRIRRFVDAAIGRKPDFIIQCGDFCCAKGGIDTAKGLLAEWNRFPGGKHHVIGNHDCDFQTKEELVAAWKTPGPYYSFDAGGFHFVILDRNHFIDSEGKAVSYDKGNWYDIHRRGGPGHLARVSCIDEAQLEWLAKDLAATDKPVVIFQHQPSGTGSHEGNWADPNHVIDRHNARRQNVQVVAVFAGHDHDEVHAIRHGVHHITMTSSTFGLPFDSSAVYYAVEKPPFTFVTLNASRGEMRIEESRSTYVEEEKMKPEPRWINPPAIIGRVLKIGGQVPV